MKEAQAEAAGHGLSLQDFLAGVLQARLASKHDSGVGPASWKDFYGSLRHLHGEREKIEAAIAEEFEQVDDRKTHSIAEAVRRDDELTAGVVVGREHGEVMRVARQRLGCA